MVSDQRQQNIYERAYGSVEERFPFPDPKILDGWTPPSNARILSVGAGTGRDVWHLTSRLRVHAIDFAKSGLEVAARHGLYATRADVTRGLPYTTGAFDLVILKDILEHVIEPESLAREARRVVRPGGRVVISVPNHFSLVFRLRILFGGNLLWRSLGHDHTQVFEEWNYMHLRFFSIGGFRRFLDCAGLVPERFFWDFGTLAHYNQPEMVFGAQVEKRRLGLPLSRRARIALAVLRPAYTVFNTVFPRPLRHAIVGLAPGLLCAGFYVRCRVR
jgi:SAM-dependent methyltransferase